MSQKLDEPNSSDENFSWFVERFDKKTELLCDKILLGGFHTVHARNILGRSDSDPMIGGFPIDADKIRKIENFVKHRIDSDFEKFDYFLSCD